MVSVVGASAQKAPSAKPFDCQTGNVITTFQSLIVFMAGGTLTESTSGTAPALRTPREGVWRHTTDNNYAFRFKHFRFNAQNVLTG